jgi:hypothetical protein
VNSSWELVSFRIRSTTSFGTFAKAASSLFFVKPSSPAPGREEEVSVEVEVEVEEEVGGLCTAFGGAEHGADSGAEHGALPGAFFFRGGGIID